MPHLEDAPRVPDFATSGAAPDHRAHNGAPKGPAGTYTYRRVFHDERTLELLPDGSIGEGAGSAETHWSVRHHPTGDILEIDGEHGVICELRQEPDRVWRGRWRSFERMPIELYPDDCPIPPAPEYNKTVKVDDTKFHFVSYAQFVADVKTLARKLPRVRAVVGNPRSGILPATIIAADQNVPLLPLEEVLFAPEPHIPSLRRRRIDPRDDRPILIVDDTVYSGQQFAYLHSRVKTPVLWAGVYVERSALHLVDFHHSLHRPVAQTYEWTLLHDCHCGQFLCDLDGVLCQDWHGDEEADPGTYRDHIENVAPLRIPTEPVMGIVTGRLPKYREQTERWLARHDIRYSQLHMIRADSVANRTQYGAAAFKAYVYERHRRCIAFIESCPDQAACIHGITGRPVLDFTSMKLFSKD